MKPSLYNYYIKTDDDKLLIVFNGLTKSFFLVTIQNADSIKYVINHPNEYIERKEFLSLINSLSSKGFILEDNISELDCIERDYYQYINSDTYLLLILTTYNCNFNCWYCVQEHNNEFLSSETSGRIKKHIAKYLIENNIKNFQLSWFGGEPTLRPDTIVDISSFASQFCKQNSINFQNSITTNGSLLSEKLILQFALCGLNTYQITIDGKQDLHNKVRYNNSIKDSFSTICHNIIRLLNIIPEADITLRYNYTASNLDLQIVDDINRQFPEEYRSRIKFFPRKVWQEDENDIPEDVYRALCDKIISSGYSIELSHDIFSGICYAEKKHFNSIFQNGRVDKCSNIGLSQTRGSLDTDGNIVWDEDLIEYGGAQFLDNELCRECKFLPLCNGFCPVHRRKDKEEGKPKSCSLSNNVKYYERVIKSFVSNTSKSHIHD